MITQSALIRSSEDHKIIALIMRLRTMGITDMRVLGALERIPRDIFLPHALKSQAYEDMALPIGLGQTISQPFVVAMMTQALDLSDRDKVLEIGTGCGYQAAILARLCRRLYTIERHKPLLRKALEHLETLRIRNITAICADGMKGWPEQAPFDKIIVTAAARLHPPHALLQQLRPDGGILVIPVDDTHTQMLRRYKRESEDTYAIQDLMPVRFVPLLPDIAQYRDYTSSDLATLKT